jgi:hypothetical protein
MCFRDEEITCLITLMDNTARNDTPWKALIYREGDQRQCGVTVQTQRVVVPDTAISPDVRNHDQHGQSLSIAAERRLAVTGH